MLSTDQPTRPIRFRHDHARRDPAKFDRKARCPAEKAVRIKADKVHWKAAASTKKVEPPQLCPPCRVLWETHRNQAQRRAGGPDCSSTACYPADWKC